ncbi:hypothetical protein CIL03_10295 [Virgibacillus indicus]|uniref:Uncharacterized protein n=1 Tax=Virgibacillus indicus TaxID=2024554 RepID=A0A265N9F5_9BACI|nr:hypothetical protein [Virgibacillus indicus]OZU88670.1 hypothetical protein CIL03_10295 [Virgibacillus indicus]
MKATNSGKNKQIIIHAGYSEASIICEALSSYQLAMQQLYGINSEEEKYIGELLHAIRNPEVIKQEACERER